MKKKGLESLLFIPVVAASIFLTTPQNVKAEDNKTQIGALIQNDKLSKQYVYDEEHKSMYITNSKEYERLTNKFRESRFSGFQQDICGNMASVFSESEISRDIHKFDKAAVLSTDSTKKAAYFFAMGCAIVECNKTEMFHQFPEEKRSFLYTPFKFGTVLNKIQPHLAENWAGPANTLFSNNLYYDMLAEFCTAVFYNPDYVPKVLDYMQNGEIKKYAWTSFPVNKAIVYNMLGSSLNSGKHYTEAYKMFKRSYDEGNDNPLILLEMARCAKSAGDLETADTVAIAFIQKYGPYGRNDGFGKVATTSTKVQILFEKASEYFKPSTKWIPVDPIKSNTETESINKYLLHF
jgi:tetratricopeptide (TPR) repeat protein